MRVTTAAHSGNKFPWGYAAAALVAPSFLALMFALPVFLSGLSLSGALMLCAATTGYLTIGVMGWGLVRLSRGDAKRFPAIPWVMLAQAMGTLAMFALN